MSHTHSCFLLIIVSLVSACFWFKEKLPLKKFSSFTCIDSRLQQKYGSTRMAKLCLSRYGTTTGVYLLNRQDPNIYFLFSIFINIFKCQFDFHFSGAVWQKNPNPEEIATVIWCPVWMHQKPSKTHLMAHLTQMCILTPYNENTFCIFFLSAACCKRYSNAREL